MGRPPFSFHPFTSEFDYAFAVWLHSIQSTKGDIKRLLNDTRLNQLTSCLSFKSADDWEEKLHRLPLGIVNEEWTKTRYEPITRIQGIHRPLYYCVYRDVVKAIKFLIGHRPFRDSLMYSPTRVYNTSNQRVYNELYTADWWWETQARLPDGATVVPVLLATDKTQLTTHHGDKSSWPVYITIGNLNRKTRRKQNLPANLLLGFIPNMKSIDYDTRSACYHKAMEEMLKPLESLWYKGINMECADGRIRQCYPVICGIMADYKEQVLITGVKSQ